MAGRKKLPPVANHTPELNEELLAQTTAEIDALHAMQADYNAERDLVNQVLGQIQMADAFSQFSATVATSKMAYIKEIKAYRALAGKKSGDGRQFSGTWDEFCELTGSSRRKIDEDIQNLQVLGEQALESMSRMGIGYRELRQYRKLPADSRSALAAAAQTGDKDGLLELAEELIARQLKDKEALAAANAEQAATLAARERVIEDKDGELNKLREKLARLEGADRVAALLTAYGEAATAVIRELHRLTVITGDIYAARASGDAETRDALGTQVYNNVQLIAAKVARLQDYGE